MGEDRSEATLLLRGADTQDLSYCENLYSTEMERYIRDRNLNLDVPKHLENFRKTLNPTEIRIITLEGADIGWLQTRTEGDALFLAQFFVDTRFQRRGIGSRVLERLIREAENTGRSLTLGVVKTNPVLRLYKRFGFQTTHEDERKFYMRRDAQISP